METFLHVVLTVLSVVYVLACILVAREHRHAQRIEWERQQRYNREG